jgi:hypothetical protein
MTIYFENDLQAGKLIGLMNFGTGIDGTKTITTATETYIQVYVSHADTAGMITANTGQLIQDQTGDFSRFSYAALAPTNAAYAKVSFNWTNPNSEAGEGADPSPDLDDYIWIDSAMLEQTAAVGDYFDGNGGFSATADIFWEGTANASRSHYYKNYTAASHRLQQDLVNYLMDGTTYTFLVAQPNT